MPTSPMSDAVILHLAPSVRAELEELARTSSREPSALVAEALTAYLDAQRWQADLIRRRMNGGEEALATDDEVEAAYAAFE